MRDAAGSLRTFMGFSVIANAVRSRAAVPSIEYPSASIPAVNQPANVPAVNELATVGGIHTHPHLPEKPLFVVHEALYSLVHKGVRIGTAVGGKPGKPSLQVRIKTDFHVSTVTVEMPCVKRRPAPRPQSEIAPGLPLHPVDCPAVNAWRHSDGVHGGYAGP